MKILGLLLLVDVYTTAEVRISLNSDQLDGTWTLENANKSIRVNGRVPGGVFTDLMDTQVLNESIYYGLNDQVNKWVGRDNWTYSRMFDLPENVLNKQVINLVLHGADTLGEVIVNGEKVGDISNMHVRYVFPIKNIAKPTGNTLEVRFFGPVTSAANIYAAQPRVYPPECTDPNVVGECHINMLRKMPCSFGWDWGPAYASSGLWKLVEVEATDDVIIRDVTTQVVKLDQSWEITVTIYAELATEDFDGTAYASFYYNRDKKIETSVSFGTKAPNLDFVKTLKVNVVQPVELWWPNGYGDQVLYDLEVVMRADEADLVDEVRKSVKVGFRTVEIVQDQIQENMNGSSFYFKVNDVPIFAKGANWIPSTLLPEKSYDRDYIHYLLLTAKESHMNMFRIWGGGIYESDTFYEIADELGIMIWQDFMFSDAVYPVDDGFISSVHTEVDQQIKRIQHHPCIVMWSGNNENEAMLMGFFTQKPDFDVYKAEYRKLYLDTIQNTLKKLDPNRYFVGSSPSNGALEESFEWLHPDAGNYLYGDAHYYNFDNNSWNPWNFPTIRFVSEYGYEGMNSIESIKKVSDPSDWSITSNFSLNRYRGGTNYDRLTKYIKYNLPLPVDDSSFDYFQLYIYYSQITQATSVKTITEKFRRDRSLLTEDNKGQTMGALYWMYNDVWPAPTWASIEFGGRWKLLQYYAKKFFAPALISMAPTADGHLDVYLVSDFKEDIPQLNVQIMTMSYDSFEPKWLDFIQADLKSLTSYSIWNATSIDDLLKTSGCDPTTCFIHVVLRDGSGGVMSENFHFPRKFHDVKLAATNMKAEIIAESNTSVTIKLRSDAIAVFVWLETSIDGVFSDNGFVMTAAEMDITFETRGEALDLETFKKTLTVRDLSSTKPKNILTA